jgi:hypothetical protein
MNTNLFLDRGVLFVFCSLPLFVFIRGWDRFFARI